MSNTIRLTHLATLNVEETGCDPTEDVAALRSGATTPEALLEHCLDGAADDRVRGWQEYVDSIAAAASVL